VPWSCHSTTSCSTGPEPFQVPPGHSEGPWYCIIPSKKSGGPYTTQMLANSTRPCVAAAASAAAYALGCVATNLAVQMALHGHGPLLITCADTCRAHGADGAHCCAPHTSCPDGPNCSTVPQPSCGKPQHTSKNMLVDVVKVSGLLHSRNHTFRAVMLSPASCL
jgi:hypothetical protein